MSAAEPTERQRLDDALKLVLEVEPESLVRKEVLGVFNFQEAVPLLRKIRTVFEDVKSLDLSGLPDLVLAQIRSVATTTRTTLEQIRDFDPQTGNPKAERQTRLANLKSLYDNTIFPVLSPVFGFARRAQEDVAAFARRAEQALKDLDATKQEAAAYAQETKKRSDSILATAQKAAVQVGVAQQSVYFRDRANEHHNEARKWLWATVCCAFLVVIFAILSFVLDIPHLPTSGTSETAHLVKYVSFRVVVLSLLLYALVWSAQNYRASRHNEVVNRHRQTALDTFEAFVKAASDDPATKNAVLLQTTQSIFAISPSGYLSSEPEPSPQNVFVDVMGKALSTKKD